MAKITLVAAARHGYARSGHFNAFRVAIVSRRQGAIDATTLFFADSMPPLKSGRPAEDVEPYIRAAEGWRWYRNHGLPEPDTGGVVSAVERFVDHWR